MKKTTVDGAEGIFLSLSEYQEIKEKIIELKKGIEIAKGESKYKLKKLSKMIERKDAKIAKLVNEITGKTGQ